MMNNQASKKLAYVLRHNPSSIGARMNDAGWVIIDEVTHGLDITMSELRDIVDSDSKGRYEFNNDCSMIRACQGHSVEVNLGLVDQSPPEVLYHGTPRRNLQSILENGLMKGDRHSVHLSVDVDTAAMVGARRGECVILVIDAGVMYRDGFVFTVSNNGVWLTDHVPAGYVKLRQVE